MTTKKSKFEKFPETTELCMIDNLMNISLSSPQ